ncbi:hypothetical protein Elgi_37750 [Paenibacillus elgii]|uniref:hypothetical protein n=1 Tax=Paenibacillus elgii TaxID=189691 RepID=UPI002D7D036C|nr:hypothetical protein Elgi_37750 [Paenibacillus elgii]
MEITAGNIYRIVLGVNCEVKVDKITDTEIEFRVESKRSKSGWKNNVSVMLKEDFMSRLIIQ